MARSSHQQARRRNLIVRGLLGPSPEQNELTEQTVGAEVDGNFLDDSESTVLSVPVSRFAPAHHTAGGAAVRRLLEGQHAVTWIFTGDQTTLVGGTNCGFRGFPEHFAERVRAELQRPLDVVVNTGISGDLALNLRKTLRWRAIRFRPDVVSVSLGMNDAKAGPEGRYAFRRQFRGILNQIRGARAIPLVHTPTPVYRSGVSNRHDLPAYVEIIREEAARFDVPVIDHWSHWMRLQPDPEALLAWLGDRRLQPGSDGHRELARLLFHELGIYDASSPTCM